MKKRKNTLLLITLLMCITGFANGRSTQTLKDIADCIRRSLSPGSSQQTIAVGSYTFNDQEYFVVASSNTSFPREGVTYEGAYDEVRSIIADKCGISSFADVLVTILGNVTPTAFPRSVSAVLSTNGALSAEFGQGWHHLAHRPENVHAEMAIHYYFGLRFTNAPSFDQEDGLPEDLVIGASRAPCGNCSGAMGFLSVEFGCATSKNTRKWKRPFNQTFSGNFTSQYETALDQIEDPMSNFGSALFKGSSSQKAGQKASQKASKKSSRDPNSLYNLFTADFSFTESNSVSTQSQLDNKGRFEGTVELELKSRNKSHAFLMVKIDLQNFDGTKWNTVKSYQNIYSNMFGENGEKRMIDFSVNILRKMPNGKYRIKAFINPNSDFHHDRDASNNLFISKERFVSARTKRFLSHRDNGILPLDENESKKPLFKNEDQNLITYPNPANTYFIISNNTENSKARLIDVYGNILIPTNTLKNKEIIDTSSLSEGLYFLEYEDKNKGRLTKRILINH